MNKLQVIGNLVLLLWCIEETSAYPLGAPTTVCDSMIPASSHGSTQPDSTSPYAITSSAIPNGYIPGQTYTVTISKNSESDTDFKGFLCQVRQVGQSQPIGTFAPRDAVKAQPLDCSREAGAVTHQNRDTVSMQVFDWTASGVGAETEVEVVCTVVQTLKTLWVKLRSATFKELESNGTVATEAPVIVQQVPIDFSGCGTSKTCYQSPSGCSSTSSCNYGLAVTYNENNKSVTILLVSNSGGYVALGFSIDDEMGHDDVIACQRNSFNDQVFAKDCWNPRGREPNVIDTDQSSIISSSGQYVDGGIACIIKRQLSPTDSTQDYNLTNSYRALFATSPQRGGRTDALVQHRAIPAISSEAIDFRIAQIIEIEGKPLIKAHGILMVIAWISLASVGILLARYYKVVWPEGGWFNKHRVIMVVATLISTIAYIIIFVEAGEWVYNESYEDRHNAHPIIGIICICLAFTNPVMAMFRCHPGTPNRWIFNWAHFLVGVSALVFGIIATFLGIDFARDIHFTDLSQNATSLLAVWLAVLPMFWVVLEIMSLMQKRKADSSDIEMKTKTEKDASHEDDKPKKEPSEDARLRQGILLAYVVVSFAFSIPVMVYIGIAEV